MSTSKFLSLSLLEVFFSLFSFLFLSFLLKEPYKNPYVFTQSFIYYWRRQWPPTPALLPGKSHGLRILVGCSPWGRKELDMTERLHFHFSLPRIGEGNGSPLQCSCLENILFSHSPFLFLIEF